MRYLFSMGLLSHHLARSKEMPKVNGWEVLLKKPEMEWQVRQWGNVIGTSPTLAEAAKIMAKKLKDPKEQLPEWVHVYTIAIGDTFYCYNHTYKYVGKDGGRFTFEDALGAKIQVIPTRGMIWTGDLTKPSPPNIPVGMVNIYLPKEINEAIMTLDAMTDNSCEHDGVSDRMYEEINILVEWSQEPVAFPRDK